MMPHAPLRCRSRRLVSFAIAAAILQAALRQALAATDNWTDESGNWSTAASWTTPPSTHNVPGAADTVTITLTDGISRTIKYDYAGAAVSLGLLTIDLTNRSGNNTTTFSMAANNLTAATEYLGFSGAGSNG